MANNVLGIHHVTAIAGDPQKNLDFYTSLLGLRLVKLTVNYDDPGTYHFYYGDETGRPGTILTFFPWPGARRGRRGTGQVTVTSFSVPGGSFGYWTERFKSQNVLFDEPVRRFDEEVLSFFDPDGMALELVACSDTRSPWKDSPVPHDHAIRGFYSVTITVEGYERTASLLTEVMGFRHAKEDGNRFRYEVGAGGVGAVVDVQCLPSGAMGKVAVGTVHHIAWRVANGDEQNALRQDIVRFGLNVTPVINRKYFHSIYFREPGHVLFEIATDVPGFAVDEKQEQLGMKLQLPPWLESQRTKIEQVLPPLQLSKSRER
ncbi:MAG TPA: ring-cleaving dioxygenase [Thermodesulfobacteriota bacterium]|nr:ring-cleaving dioxygenase [Thermodesulfobacteriota bacterium]